MKLFNIDHNKLTFSPEALAIKAFKAIWDRDKSSTKDKAVEELAYVYYVADYQSIYKAYDIDVRESRILKDVITDPKWKPDDIIRAAIDKYMELQITPSMGILIDAEGAVERIRGYLRTVDTSDDANGKKTQTLIANVKELGTLIKGIKALSEIVDSEVNEHARIRGKGTLGLREVPKK